MRKRSPPCRRRSRRNPGRRTCRASARLAIVIDEGPLVLVETKRDLQGMKLPFEQGTLPLQ